MDYKTPILLTCLTALSMGSPCLAQDFKALHEDNARDAVNKRIEIEDSSWGNYRARDSAETIRADAHRRDTRSEAWTTDNFADRFINPHPELGCLFYDENNSRHWFPNCREL